MCSSTQRFNPRLPGGRRLTCRHVLLQRCVVSIHAFRGEGDLAYYDIPNFTVVSIHAFRGEGDRRRLRNRAQCYGFNPRLPGGRRPLRSTLIASMSCFNPRLPGGRRPLRSTLIASMSCFNPRLPGGRRLDKIATFVERRRVSIHAFRGEGDRALLRRALADRVSIHAFRGEGDALGGIEDERDQRFNPRLPGGRRLPVAAQRRSPRLFQSTPSGGKATM